MFSGIIEAKSAVLKTTPTSGNFQITVQKPSTFNDLKVGDSIANNGVCLTVEEFNQDIMVFTLAAETLHITGWNEQQLTGMPLNLERSLKVSDRVHGHFVSGHVDAKGIVTRAEDVAGSWYLDVQFPQELSAYLWKKGSVALHGVSLTINEITEDTLSVCLIPETLRQTNLGEFKVGDGINIEVDSMARAMVRNIQLGNIQTEERN